MLASRQKRRCAWARRQGGVGARRGSVAHGRDESGPRLREDAGADDRRLVPPARARAEFGVRSKASQGEVRYFCTSLSEVGHTTAPPTHGGVQDTTARRRLECPTLVSIVESSPHWVWSAPACFTHAATASVPICVRRPNRSISRAAGRSAPARQRLRVVATTPSDAARIPRSARHPPTHRQEISRARARRCTQRTTLTSGVSEPTARTRRDAPPFRGGGA